MQKNKKYQIDSPCKVKDELGKYRKYAHRYETQTVSAYFRLKYQQYTLKRTTVNNWKCKLSNPQKEWENHQKYSTKKVDIHWLE